MILMQGQEDLYLVMSFPVLWSYSHVTTNVDVYICTWHAKFNTNRVARVENMRKIPKQSWKVSKITGMFLEFTGNVQTFYNPKHKLGNITNQNNWFCILKCLFLWCNAAFSESLLQWIIQKIVILNCNNFFTTVQFLLNFWSNKWIIG